MVMQIEKAYNKGNKKLNQWDTPESLEHDLEFPSEIVKVEVSDK